MMRGGMREMPSMSGREARCIMFFFFYEKAGEMCIIGGDTARGN